MTEPCAGVSVSKLSAPQMLRRYFVGQKTLMRRKERFSSRCLITRYEPSAWRHGPSVTEKPGVVRFERGSGSSVAGGRAWVIAWGGGLS